MASKKTSKEVFHYAYAWLNKLFLFQTFTDEKWQKLKQLRIVFSPLRSLFDYLKIAIGHPLNLRLYAAFCQICFKFANAALHGGYLRGYVGYWFRTVGVQKHFDAMMPVGYYWEMVPL